MNQTVKVAIMQPYFLPYIGYWQLMHHVDTFVVYDDIEYTKKGWINRNRFLLKGQPEIFTLPLKKDSDFLEIRQRRLSDSFDSEIIKLFRRLDAAYRKSPYFCDGHKILNEIFNQNKKNLFEYIYESIKIIHTSLNLSSQLVKSSTLGISKQLKGQDRVLAICKALGATNYINPIGGIELYEEKVFSREGIHLNFQRCLPVTYKQFEHNFIPNLSIIDNIMFIGLDGVKLQLSRMELL